MTPPPPAPVPVPAPAPPDPAAEAVAAAVVVPPERATAFTRVKQLVVTARPYSLLWFVAVPMTAMAVMVDGSDLDLGRLALVIVACMCGDAAFTTFNDICDVDTDRLSPETQRRARPVASGALPVSWARVQVAVLATICGVLSFAVALPFGLLLLAGMLYGAAYSGLGLRIVGRPVVSQLYWVVLWPSMYFGVLLATSGTWWRGVPYVVGTILFMGVAETLAKDLRDLRNDAAAGKITTPVRLGARRSAQLAFAALLVGCPLLAASPLALEEQNLRLVAGLAVVLALWLGRAFLLTRVLASGYDHAAARTLHVGAIRVFLTVNLLIVAGA